MILVRNLFSRQALKKEIPDILAFMSRVSPRHKGLQFLKRLRFTLVLTLYGQKGNLSHGWAVRYDSHYKWLLHSKIYTLYDPDQISIYQAKLDKLTNDLKYVTRPLCSAELSSLDMLISKKLKYNIISLTDIYDNYSLLKAWINNNIGDYMGLYRACCQDISILRRTIASYPFYRRESIGILIQANGWNTTYGHLGFLAVFLKALQSNLLIYDEVFLYMVHPDDPFVSNRHYQKYLIEYAQGIKQAIVRTVSFRSHHDVFMLDHVQMDCWEFKDTSRTLEEAIDFTHKNTDSTQLCLDDLDLDKGRNFLSDIGFADSRFVTVQIRDGSYGGVTGISRNSNVNDYKEAMTFLTSIGINVILITNQCHSLSHDFPGKIFDYSHSPKRSPLLDLFVQSQCLFYICNLSGPLEVANSYGTNVLLTNSPSISRCSSVYRPNTLCVPRLLYDANIGQYISFKECFDSWRSQVHTSEIPSNLCYIPNTSNELVSGVIDMLEYVESGLSLESFLAAPEKVKYVNAYNDLRAASGIKYGLPVSPRFLTIHSHLLN